jgi:hypothetical protein
MASQAKIVLILTHFQKIPAAATVRLVARKAIALLNRWVNIFLRPLWVMALAAESSAFCRQFETLAPLDRVHFGLLLMT